MNRTSSGVMRLRDTIRPLAFAPLAGLSVLTLGNAPQWGSATLIFALFRAPFCYAAAIVFALPILWLVPRSRTPGLVAGAIWGGLAAWAAAGFVAPSFREWVRWEVVLGYATAGVASGLLYAYLVRARSHQNGSWNQPVGPR